MTTPQTRNERPDQGDYECIDPTLGEQLWRREDPDCPDELSGRLDSHLGFCARCRMQVSVGDRVAAGLRDGSLQVGIDGVRRRKFADWTFGAGIAAVAAGLMLILTLPPRAPHEDLVLRGGGAPMIERPVPGEVVRGGRLTVRWTELEGATYYKVDITMVGGKYYWSTTTEETAVEVPVGMELPEGERFRVSVKPVPEHLAPEMGLRSSFRTGGLGSWMVYRVTRGVVVGKVIGLLGLVGLVGWAVRQRR